MLYIRYPLSFRQVEYILFERSIDIHRETVRFWSNRFGPVFAAEIRKQRIQHWRAVDREGGVLEVSASIRRDRKADLEFLRRARPP